ncbi:cytochrome P450, partial [Thamnocephalis sphaerospora]
QIVGLLTSPLASLPGPWYTKFTGFAHILAAARQKSWSHLLELHDTYGPIVRLGPDTISVVDAKDVRTVLATHKFRKGRLYEGSYFGGEPNVIATRDPSFHRMRKKMVAPVFSNVYLQNMEPIMHEVGLNKLFKVIEARGASNTPMDLMGLLMHMTLDVMGALAFGGSFNMLDTDSHPVTDWMHGTAMLSVGVSSRASSQASNSFAQYTMNMVEKRRQMKNPPKDILQTLVEAVDDETGLPHTPFSIASEIIVLMMAGSGTSSITLSWTMICLLQRPEYMKRLVAEIDEAFPSIDETITHAKVQNLPFLNAVLHETLRFRSPAATETPRVAPAEGATLSGFFIPGDTEIVVTPLAIMCSKTNFDKPDQYLPDRWFEETDSIKEMKSSFLAFSSGVRACLGRNLAWLELRVTLASLVRKFEFTLVPGQDLNPTTRHILEPVEGKVMVTAVKRTA